MKKIINLIIISIMLTVMLTACSNKGNTHNDQVENSEISQKIDTDNISYATSFSNGFAFIQYKNADNPYCSYCIDKTGKEIFKIENTNLYNCAKFNEKIAMVETTTPEEFIICDKNGNVTKAEKFGASRFVLETINHRKAFLDGYIILERQNESYNGTKIEMSIINSAFETLAPFSEDLAETISSLKTNGTYYFDGYFCFDDILLDLRTGEKISDRTKINTKNIPLFYSTESGEIYNDLTGGAIAKISENESISEMTFIGSLGLAKYNTDNGLWFNIMAQDGSAKFQPIKAGEAVVKFDGETILTAEKCSIKKENSTIDGIGLKTYDINGNLMGETTVETKYSVPITVASIDAIIDVNESIIKVSDGETYLFFDSVLKELF